MGLDRLDLGSEDQAFLRPAEIERLLSHAVARQLQPPLLPVPHCKCEHASGPTQRLGQSPVGNGRKKRFGVGMTAPVGRRTSRRQVAPQLQVIVDFAIEGNDIPAAVRKHRLVARLRGIDDRQSRVAERDACWIIIPAADVVRATMAKLAGHHADSLSRLSVARQDSGQATHGCRARSQEIRGAGTGNSLRQTEPPQPHDAQGVPPQTTILQWLSWSRPALAPLGLLLKGRKRGRTGYGRTPAARNP